MTPIRAAFALPMIAMLAACGGAASDAPAGPVPPEIAQRQDNFEAIKDAFIAIRAQFEEGVTPDLAAVEASASDINTRAGAIAGYFPAGSGMDDGWDTEALATIWAQPDTFAAAQQRLLDASAGLMAAAASGDAAATGAEVGSLGMACKNCHDTFRLPQD